MAPNEIRNRKTATNSSTTNKKKQKGEKDTKKSSQTDTAAARPRPPAAPETLWETFKSHPLVMVAPYILIPYLLYKMVLMVALRRPDVMTGLVELRPAVRMNEPRQVLILGAIGSGTKQVTEGLSKVMRLEIAHEGMNSRELFTRDGTASNLLGIRYAPISYGRERLSSMLSSTCLSKAKASGSAFSLSNYQPSDCWPWPMNNQTCRQRECLNFVGKEFGCGLATVNACPTPFARVIHLVRHPIHVLQQLVPKICPGNITATKSVHPAFRQMAGVFLRDDDSSLCVASLAWYMVDYNRALVEARKQGHIDVMLQYESLTLCGLAQASGFADPEAAVYAPNVDKVKRLCSEDAADRSNDVYKTLPELETRSSDETVQLAKLEWNHFETVGGIDLVKALKELCQELGYDLNAPFLTEDNGLTKADEESNSKNYNV